MERILPSLENTGELFVLRWKLGIDINQKLMSSSI
jgi:hypothetical protein